MNRFTQTLVALASRPEGVHFVEARRLCGVEAIQAAVRAGLILPEIDGTLRASNPGSPSAVSQGCTCPVYDNAHGAGMGRDEHGRVVYVMSLDCPLHGAPYKRNCGTEIAATATD